MMMIGLFGFASTLLAFSLSPWFLLALPHVHRTSGFFVARLRRPLSRLGLHRPYGWLLRRAARRAQARAAACADGRCPVPEGEGAPPHP